MRDPLSNIAMRRSVALHEAGHAVAALLTGHSVRYVSTRPQGGAGGVTWINERRRVSVHHSIVISCAGMVVEDIIRDRDRADIADTGHSDIHMIRAEARYLVTEHGKGTVLEQAARAWATAVDLMVNNYGAVLAVAHAVMTSRTAVTGAQIRACIAAAPNIPAPDVPHDSRTFWVPDYATLRNWGMPGTRVKAPAR